VAVLKELGTAIGGLGPAGGVQPAAADEWQQLHLAPFEGIAESSGESPMAIKVQSDRPHSLPGFGGRLSHNTSRSSTADPVLSCFWQDVEVVKSGKRCIAHSSVSEWLARLLLQANEVLFVDSEHEDEVLTFREVFLGSRALELLLAGFIAEPPSSDEEHALLASLLGSTLGGDTALHQVVIARSTVPAVHVLAVTGRWQKLHNRMFCLRLSV
jgi:hypothetical protein